MARTRLASYQVPPVVGGGGDYGISPMAHGGVGSGATHEAAALQAAATAAHAAGVPLHEPDPTKVFGVDGNFQISALPGLKIGQLNIKQIDPDTGQTTFALINGDGYEVDGLHIDQGDDTTAGHLENTVGFMIKGGKDHHVRSLRATGSGKGTYVRFWECRHSTFEDVRVFDVEFESFDTEAVSQDGTPLGTIRVVDDVVQGISIADCYDVALLNPIVRNLQGNATYFDTSNTLRDFRNFRTRGIVGGGNVGVQVVNPIVTNTEQGIDFSGGGAGWGNRNVVIQGGITRNNGSVGVKLANAPTGCRVIGHQTFNAGMYGFLLTGNDPDFVGQGNSFIGCESWNAGYNMIRNASGVDVSTSLHAGFSLLANSSGGLLGSRILQCRAIDKRGFYLAGDDAPWVLAGGTSATLAENWTGFTGNYSATFKTTSGNETRTVLLTNGATTCTWSGGLTGAVQNTPFVSMPAQMRYGALCNAAGAGAWPNVAPIDFESIGHTVAATSGF